MEEHLGAQYAVQIAVHTLRERCKNLQQRITVLEEENINLRMSCVQKDDKHSLTEIEKLREQVTELTQQKEQCQEKVRLISHENQELWKKLGKLVSVNKSLGEQLSKISETVNQSRTPLQTHVTLIRSKTFTQDEPMTKFLQKNLELNEKISLELENVSLKLSDSFSKQKMELEKFSHELGEMKSNEMIGEHLCFVYNDKIEDDLCEEFQYVLEDLKILKSEVLEQKEVLRRNLKNLSYLCREGAPKCEICDNRKNYGCDKFTSTSDITKKTVDKFTDVPVFNKIDPPSIESVPPDIEKMCPICSRTFKKDVPFPMFQDHVENHFRLEEPGSFEII